MTTDAPLFVVGTRERRALEDACQPGFAALGPLYEEIA